MINRSAPSAFPLRTGLYLPAFGGIIPSMIRPLAGQSANKHKESYLMNEIILVDPGLPDTAEGAFGISAREDLVSCLDSCRKLNQEVADYEKQCALAEEDEAALLADHQSDEEELAEKLARLGARKRVHEKRIAARVSELRAAQSKLGLAVTRAEGQLRGEVVSLLEKRRAQLNKQVLRVLGFIETPITPPALIQLVEGSPLIRAVDSCLPTSGAFTHLSVEQRGQDIINKFERLSEQKEKAL
jgi:hypothetical protein